MCRSPRGYPPPVFEAGLEAALVNAPISGGRLRTRISHVTVPVAFQAVEVPDLLTYLTVSDRPLATHPGFSPGLSLVRLSDSGGEPERTMPIPCGTRRVQAVASALAG